MLALGHMLWCAQLLSRGCWREHASQRNRKETASSGEQPLVCIANSEGCGREHASSRDQSPMCAADAQTSKVAEGGMLALDSRSDVHSCSGGSMLACEQALPQHLQAGTNRWTV